MHIPVSAQNKAESMLLAHVADMLMGHKRAFTAFLTETEQVLIKPVTARRKDTLFYGGYPDAERVMLGVFPGEEADRGDFPILPITISLPKLSALSHRDILGSLMALSITRESIGDILIEPRRAIVFLAPAAGELALSELSRIGSAGVVCERGADLSSLPEQQYSIIDSTVSAMRLDAVVAAFIQKSRQTATGLIAAGLVSKNGRLQDSQSARVDSGDKISVRGHGKALIHEKGPSKKGRIRIEIRKYL